MKKIKNKKIYLTILLICVSAAMLSVVCFATSGYDVNTIYPDKTLFDIQDKFDQWTIHPAGKYDVYSDFDGLITIGSLQDKTKWKKITYYIKKISDNKIEFHSLALSGNGEIYDDSRVSFIWADYSYTFNNKEEVKRQEDHWKTPLKDNTAFGFYSYAPDTSVVSGTAPIYLSYESAYDYLVNNNQHLSDTFYLTDEMKCVAPENVDLFCDDNDSNKLYCTWTQAEDTDLTNYNSFVTYKYEYNYPDGKSSPYPSGIVEVNNKYQTSTYNKVLFDINNIIKKVNIGKKDGADSCIITLNVYNFDVTGVKADSEICSIRLKVTENGMYRMNRDTTTGLPDWSQPIKNETDFIKDNGYNYTPDDFVPVVENDNTSFVNNILTGFGLLGNSGFLALFSKIFNFIPAEIWTVISFYFSVAVLVALFKLIIK